MTGHEEQQAPRRRTVALMAALAGGALLLVAAAVALNANGQAQPASAVADAIASCERPEGVDVDCLHVALSLLPTAAAEELPGQLLAQVQSHPELSNSCHDLMHTLGRHLSGSAESLAQTLTTEWEPCGYGFLHGVFETQPVPDDPYKAGDKLSSLCRTGKLNETERLRGECYHALGHAVSDSQDNPQAAIDLCTEAFTDNVDRSTSALIGCYSGVAMKERDKVLLAMRQGLTIEPTQEAFEELGKPCSLGGPDFALGCAPGFVQVATDSGPRHVVPFLQWCSELLQERAAPCYQQAGVYMGHFRDNFAGLEESIELCGSAAPNYAGICRVSLVEGLLNRGEDRQSALEQACAAYEKSLGSQGQNLCLEARKSYAG